MPTTCLRAAGPVRILVRGRRDAARTPRKRMPPANRARLPFSGMAKVEMSYLLPLFELAGSMVDDDPANVSFGLAEPDANSSLARDNEETKTKGYWVSLVVDQAITASLDHAIALRYLVGSGKVTHAAPWTVLRGVLEPAALVVWVLNGSRRKRRQERALRVWYHDYTERGKWERDVNDVVVAPAKSASARAVEIVAVAKSLNLRETQVVGPLNYADVVAHAGEVIGLERALARARWRESSGFAHGRFWPWMRLGSPHSAEVIRGGYAVAVGLAEEHHREVAALATDLLERALMDWAKAAAPALT